MVVYAYILDDKNDMAKEFHNLHANSFSQLEFKNRSYALINDAEVSSIDLWKDIYFGISK